jgi:ABC-type Na+ efflux pump permease subunit
MKKSLRVLIALVALAVFLNCVQVLTAQIRTGGYKEVANDDSEVVAAADFAVNEQGRKQEASITLVSIEHAEQQVVAGINYRLCLKVETDGETQEVKAVVYRNLQREYSLTSWEQESCSGSEGD